MFIKNTIALLLPFFLSLNFANSADTLTMHVGDWSPYVDVKLSNQGVLSEIVTKAFKAADVNVNIEVVPWARVEKTIDEDNGLSFGYIKNAERLKKWHYSNSLMTGGSVLAVVKKDLSWKNYDDLKGKIIAITRGYSYGDKFDTAKKDLIIDMANTDEANLKKLLKKRVDFFAVDPVVGAKILKDKFTKKEREQIKFIMVPRVASFEMFVVCSKSNKSCKSNLDKFNKGMDKIKKDGTYEQIIK